MKQPVQIKNIKWLFLLGIVLMLFGGGLDRYNREYPPLDKAATMLEKHIHEKERKIGAVFIDPKFATAVDSSYEMFQYLDKHPLPDECELLIYNSDRNLVFWSDNRIIPANPDRIIKRDLKYIKLGNGYHVVKRFSYPKGYEAIVLMTIYHNYMVSNKFLENGFVIDKPLLRRVSVSNKEDSEASPEKAVKNSKGEYLFSIRKSALQDYAGNPFLLFLEILGFIIIFSAVNSWIRWDFIRQKYIAGALKLAAYILLVDFLVIYLQLPAFSFNNIVFSPKLYASPFWGNNLGALLIRVFFAHWLLQLILKYLINYYKIGQKERTVIMAVLLSVSFFSIIFLISSLHINSVISFEFYNFNSLDFNSFLGMIVIGTAFGLLFITGKHLRKDDFNALLYLSLIPLCLLGIGFAYLFDMMDYPLILLFAIVWFFAYLRFLQFLLDKPELFKRHRFISNLIILAMYSVLGSVIMLHYSTIRSEETAKQKAVELASERDMGEEFDFTEIGSRIISDNFIGNYFASPYMSSFDIEGRIQYKYFKNYTYKYNIITHAFNRDGYVLRGESSKSLSELLNARSQKGVQKISPFFYYLSVKPKGEKYLAVYDIQQDSMDLGYLILEFIPKVFSTYSAYPELLNKEIVTKTEESDAFSFGIFRNKLLVSNSGNFPFSQSLEFPKPENGQFRIIYKDKYRHVLFTTGEKTVVVTDKTRTFMNTVSVFSYVLIFLIFYFIMTDFAMIHKNFWGEYSLQQLFRPNTLQKQIQSSMISLVLFSLVMVGIVTFFYFSIQYNNFHNNRLLSRADAVRQILEQYYRDAFPQHRSRTYDVVIRQRLKMLSEIYSVDINTYNKQGQLTMATQPEIFKRNLISERMNSEAFEQLVIFRRSQFTHDEQIGKLSYLSAYMPFKDDNGKVLGYINFPYYGKQRSIRNDISYFLVALVNVYVLLIIGAAVAAVLLSRSITNPLAIITQNLKKVSLNKKNKPIVWANKDEIGVLVEQYNRMIGALEQSANLLAKSEREDAWREMAKQVAHEIKNPLTPMKLSIQHLQNALNDNREDLPDLTKRVTKRMIEQIDTLSSIATAFSDFARMPIGKFNQVNLDEILVSVVDLFKTYEVEIATITDGTHFEIFADKEQILRVFNNVIKNAIQSIPENVKGLITISLEEKDDICLVKIKDNGVGIPKDRFSKVFEPNFTTKSSGTGLGLAMSKSIVENAGGKIWLESVVDEGTTFYIELPKWKPTNDEAR